MRRLGTVLVLVGVGGCSLYFDEKDSASPGLPISGGTLLVTRDGSRAIASDPGADKVMIVDVAQRTMLAEVQLQPGDEPGRLVEDGNGRIHVALRRGGAVLTLDGSAIVDRRAVCAAPRGLAYEVGTDQVHVACMTGELVTLPAAGGAVTRTLDFGRDLRDVAIANGQLVVTRFRSAEVIRLDADGNEVGRGAPPSPMRDSFDQFGGFVQVPARASVAYRTVVAPNGSLIMVHQRASQGTLSVQPGGYGGGGCQRGPVEATATVFDPGATSAVATRALSITQLPVDVALAPTGDRIAVVNAGHRNIKLVWLSSLPESAGVNDPCNDFNSPDTQHGGDARWGAPVAVAWTPDNALVVQHDFAIVFRDTFGDELGAIRFGDPENENLGRRRFHQPTFSGLACASCHPEGHEDGMVWEFDSLGQRRTQDIGGNLADRAPYHWGGDMHSIDMLLEDVLVGRMGGDPLTDNEREALPQFLFSLKPAPVKTSLDAGAVARGRTLFESTELACTTCHNGTNYTNNAMVDVGTGGNFKVPSLLGVANRAPFIHTGCAPTLRDRFGACGGGAAHGATDTLTPAQLDDLVTFLESL